jgi:DNA topoisomerase-2
VDNLKRMMKNEEYQQMHPWYKGFQGSIEQQGPRSYIVRANYFINDDGDLEITELPIGKWTRDYKTFLEELADPKNGEFVDDIREMHTENRVHFIIRINNLDKIVNGEGIEKKFKLTTSISTNNYVLFDF